jgi:AraC family transcriptional regulator
MSSINEFTKKLVQNSLDSLLCTISGANPPQPIFEQIVRLDTGCAVSYVSIDPHCFPEHKTPQITIVIPFERTSFQAIWHTRSGQLKQQHVRSGHVCILPANLPHEVRLERRQESINIKFKSELIEQIAAELVGKNVEIIEQWTARDPLIRQLGSDLRREFKQQPPRKMYVESAAQVLANHLVRHYSTDPVSIEETTAQLMPKQFQQAIDYIHERIDQDISLSELADVVQMSQYRFARAFKQSTGMPPHQYLLSQRIDRAKQLLTMTQLPISDISYQLGFANQSHFTATFRRFTTVTPNMYRKG